MAQRTSLYRCDGCGYVARAEAGKSALKHIHNDDEGDYLGKDAEGRMVEFPDDGRDDVRDLRDEIPFA